MYIPASARLLEFEPRAGDAHAAAAAAFPAPASPDPAAELEQAAYARGRAEGLAEARSEYEARILAERERFEIRIAEERRAWAVEQGDRLAGCLTAALSQLSENVADAAAGILAPFVEAAAAATCVEELCGTLARVMADAPQSSLRISGPQDVLAAVRDRLGAQASLLEFEICERCDVRVLSDRTTIETQLSAWRDRLNSAGA